MQVRVDHHRGAAKTKALEVMINVPLGMAIQRLLTRSGEIPEGWQVSLDTFFGFPEWRAIGYEESEDLFGRKTSKVSDAGARALAWYRTRPHQSSVMSQHPA